MPKITYKDHQGTSKTIEVENGLSVMEGAIQKEIPGIDADCGGSMACATCHVYVEDKWFDKIPKAEDAENDMIDMAFEPKKNSRLSCQIVVSDDLDGLTSPKGYTKFTRALLKANNNTGYRLEDGTIVRITRPLKVMVMKKVPMGVVGDSRNLYVKSDSFKKGQTYDGDRMTERIGYEVKVIGLSGPGELSGIPLGKSLKVDHQDLLPDPRDIFLRSAGAALALANPKSIVDYALDMVSESLVLQTGAGSEVGGLIKAGIAGQPEQFMQPENNPFTRALESTMGRGLAGVIDGFNFNWLNNDFTWETDYNSRAPRGCEISFSLQVIHDLPPGLDHSGYNRAPLYNVGSIMKEITGDAHGDDAVAEQSYTQAGNAGYSKTGK